MKISAILSWAKNKLQQKNIETASLDSLVLLCNATSFSKEKIIFNPDLELEQTAQEKFQKMIERREKREPVSHIINHREFYGLDFFVSGDVLDPRPDSESLIELVIKIFPHKNHQFSFLELGVGSGCLSIALLKNFPNAFAMGVDISAKAIAIAQKNAQNQQVQNRFNLQQSDLFIKIAPQKFDLIISNPPYIPTQEIEKLADDVRLFEPRLALDGGVDGLNFYRKISQEVIEFLKPQGFVVVEIGYGQKKDVEKIFKENKFLLKFVQCDLAGFERVLGFELG